LFGRTPLKTQNDYIFKKFLGGMAPLGPPGFAYGLSSEPFYHICYHCSYDSNAFSTLA